MTKKLFTFATAGTLALFAVACTQVNAGTVKDDSHRTAVAEIGWGETPFGPLATPVVGDFSAGAHVTMVKFPAGMKTPVHVHSHDYTGIVVTGTSRHYVPGKPETQKALAAGSHWFIPANLPHISECLPGEECVMALYQTENFDFIPQEQ